jgi:hypothetical protein
VPDFAPATALAAPYTQRASGLVEIAFGDLERLEDPQARSPEDHDQAAHPLAVRLVVRRAHAATISSTFGGSAGERCPLLPGTFPVWNPGIVAGDRRRPARSAWVGT